MEKSGKNIVWKRGKYCERQTNKYRNELGGKLLRDENIERERERKRRKNCRESKIHVI